MDVMVIEKKHWHAHYEHLISISEGIMASALAKQVAACNRRARERGLAGTLTTLDWQHSLEFFKQQCAYCGTATAWTIDHFQALAYGGGSTHSNVVPACQLCNTTKASSFLHELPPSLISSERLLTIRTYLEAIGKRNQESMRRLCVREPRFAQMEAAVARLKVYCEQRSRESTSSESAAYGYLRLMLFGVEWDPSHYFQVTVSLSWQEQHSTLPELTAACQNAWSILHDDA